jgi:SOS response regulatory protein OraA/RecX
MLLVGMLTACGSGKEGTDAGRGQSSEKPQAEQTPQETAAQKNARQKAEEYLSAGAHSRTGLIEQLESEEFSNEDATYGVDAAGVDWRDQAAKKAKEYLDASSYSRDGLKDQLKSDGFTDDEAEYGVSQFYEE